MCPELAEYTRGIQSSLSNLNYRDGLRVTPSRRPSLLFALNIDDHNDLHARATIHWPYSSQTSCTRTHRPRERRSSRASADLHGVCASSRRGEPDDIAYPRCAPSRGPRGGPAHVFRKVPQGKSTFECSRFVKPLTLHSDKPFHRTSTPHSGVRSVR